MSPSEWDNPMAVVDDCPKFFANSMMTYETSGKLSSVCFAIRAVLSVLASSTTTIWSHETYVSCATTVCSVFDICPEESRVGITTLSLRSDVIIR